MPANITLTPEQFEAARQRLIAENKYHRERIKKELDQKRLELDLSHSAEAVYEQHKLPTPWSYGVGSRPEDIAGHCERLREELAERNAELALLEQSLTPLPPRPLYHKGTSMIKGPDGRYYPARVGEKAEFVLLHDVYPGDDLQGVVGKGPAFVKDPVADFFTPVGKDTGKNLP